MKTINYFFNDGTKSSVEVTDEFFDFYISLANEAKNNTLKENRRRVSLDRLRDEGIEIDFVKETPYDQMIQMENRSRLQKAMEMLTDKQRQVLWLIAVEELTYEGAGKKMGIRWDTVREHYEAAIKKIRKNF